MGVPKLGVQTPNCLSRVTTLKWFVDGACGVAQVDNDDAGRHRLRLAPSLAFPSKTLF